MKIHKWFVETLQLRVRLTPRRCVFARRERIVLFGFAVALVLGTANLTDLQAQHVKPKAVSGQQNAKVLLNRSSFQPERLRATVDRATALSLTRKPLIPEFGWQGPFTTIPRQARLRLSRRLQLFVRAQSERRWNDVFNLSLISIEGSLTKEAFVKEYENQFPDRKSFDLVTFKPTAATLVNINGDSKEWLLEGCAKYREKGKIVYSKAGLNAGLYGNQWYFGYLSELTRGTDGPALRCSLKSNFDVPARNVKSRMLTSGTLARRRTNH